ncbi:divalent-cation tolerance protein CutA [Phragmitibacter flavus]|uniref:Divalent-cation tolerance protein CutA n=1 Tax=Phragmitibacter flavus TaxID=2576071 RepID=A0A5R8KBV9_9BACT|nr:divalent-cation tolerance protein CutA [Phragmitibacter flavus]TLD69727.1 divalent-cation tolerance protein CutA [Phragmitibacter flavus]
MDTEILIVFCTMPSVEKARQIATVLVESQLVACVNLCPSVESIYRWEGKVETASEVLAVMKTTRERYADLEVRLRELHPYEVPEIVAVPVVAGLPEYLHWVTGATGG